MGAGIAPEAQRLHVVLVELTLGDIAVIALDLLLGLELGAEVGGFALAALAVLAGTVFTLVERAPGTAPDILAHPAVYLIFRFCALRHRGSSEERLEFRERALLCVDFAPSREFCADRLPPSSSGGHGCVKRRTRPRRRARSARLSYARRRPAVKSKFPTTGCVAMPAGLAAMRRTHLKPQILSRFRDPCRSSVLVRRKLSPRGASCQDFAMQFSHDSLRCSIDLCAAID